jgi:predicted dehydrogenase/threonine dehydrogenase-like Zn-dependent dehydrogenase
VKQVSYQPRTGAIQVEDVPEPGGRPGWVLVRNHYSLISAGTERSKIDLGRKSLLAKARARPDLVRKVVDRARIEGPRAALAVAQDRLAALAPLGYSSAGTVISVGSGVAGLAPGDRVACGGGLWANHAEVILVPKNLVARVPEGGSLESACYATVGAIALHGVRQSEAALGEHVGVIGLGLVGQLATRLLVAAGCTVVGIDLDPAAVALAERGGARGLQRDDPGLGVAVAAASEGRGLDAVIVCAAGSADPLVLGAELCRQRGRVVLVGDVPIELDRALMYDKELELRLSRSYGPGRYDRDYEEHGRDLPAEYVRWTEQRNLQAFVDLSASGRIDPTELTTHRFSVDQAAEAYGLLVDATQAERPFGVVLEYEAEPASATPRPARSKTIQGPRIGLIGAGAFARATLLPGLRAAGVGFEAVASTGGLSAADVATRFGFDRAVTPEELLADERVDAVVIATRHASHADYTAAALRAGKHVFVEKPLALTLDELARIEDALRMTDATLMVGFNRRYAPLTLQLRNVFEGVDDAIFTARVNAGRLAGDHWLHDPEEGGGRLVGEGCHFVDLLAHLACSPPRTVFATAVAQPDRSIESSDTVSAVLRFANGSVATLAYTGGGDTRLPKERFEVFGGGSAAVLDDFRRLEVYRGGRRTVTKSAQDKGHQAELAAFAAATRGEADAPAAESYLASTRATLALAESLRTGLPVDVG